MEQEAIPDTASNLPYAKQDKTSQFRFFDIDPLEQQDYASSDSGRCKYEDLMRRYQLGNQADSEGFVWDLFVYRENASTGSILDLSVGAIIAQLLLMCPFRPVIDLGPDVEMTSVDDDPLLFGEYSASDCDTDDSNAAENPNFSYPEEDSDESIIDASDCSSADFDAYKDDNLDAIDDFDQS